MSIGIVCCLVIAGGLYVWVSRDRGVLVGNTLDDDSSYMTVVDPIDLPQTQGEGIVVARSYVDGVYIYTGEINLPTPCHELSHFVEIKDTQPKRVSINFIATTKSEMCAQVVFREPFSVTVNGVSDDAVVNMTLNGNELPFSITHSGEPKRSSIVATTSTSRADESQEETMSAETATSSEDGEDPVGN